MSGKIFIITQWFWPGYKAGGPIRSIQNMVEALPFEFYILTTNQDWGSNKPYTGVSSDQWVQYNERTKVWYGNAGKWDKTLFLNLLMEINPDVLYLNSMFSMSYTWKPLLEAKKIKFEGKIVLAPRGMLHPNAMNIKGTKKQWFISFLKFIGWTKGLTWQATSAEESKYIQSYFGDQVSISLSENLPTLSPIKTISESVKNRWLMVNRLSEEKGVLEGLQWWVSHPISSQAVLTIIGSSADAHYQAQVQQCIEENTDKKIQWLGDLPPDQVTHWMAKSDFFYSPTRGENYGHAIAEALFMGLPAVVAEGTPWQKLSDKGWGWNFKRNQQSLHQVLDEVVSMNNEQYRLMHQNLLTAREEEIKKIHNSESWILLFGTNKI